MSVKDSPNSVRRRFGFWASAFCMSNPRKTPSSTLAFICIFKLWRCINSRFIDIGELSRQSAWCCYMTTYYDVPADMLISALADNLADSKEFAAPDWSDYVKTGADRERPPTQSNWWVIRAASILRKVAKNGPVGVTSLAQSYGGIMNNGAGPNTPGVASRHIIRTALQQLESAGLVELVPTKEIDSEDGKQQLYSGRRVTSKGQKLLNEMAHSCRSAADEMYPGLAKY